MSTKIHLKIITPPISEPINLEYVKDYLRVDGTDDDQIIQNLISAAREFAEKFTRRSLAAKTYELIYDGFSEQLFIPNPPLITIDSVKIIDFDGNELIPSYEVKEREPAMLSIEYVGEASETRIQFKAGYDELPKPIEQALLLLISHFYENRMIVSLGNYNKLPFTVESLLYPYKVRWF